MDHRRTTPTTTPTATRWRRPLAICAIPAALLLAPALSSVASAATTPPDTTSAISAPEAVAETSAAASGSLLVDVDPTAFSVAPTADGGALVIDAATSTATLYGADGTPGTPVALSAVPTSPVFGPDDVLYGAVAAEDGTATLAAIPLGGEAPGTVVTSAVLSSTPTIDTGQAPWYGQGTSGIVDRTGGGLTLMPYVDATGAASGASVDVANFRATLDGTAAQVESFGLPAAGAPAAVPADSTAGSTPASSAAPVASASSWAVDLSRFPGFADSAVTPGPIVAQIDGGAVWVVSRGAPVDPVVATEATTAEPAATAVPATAGSDQAATAPTALTTGAGAALVVLGADGSVSYVEPGAGWYVAAADVSGVILARPGDGAGVEVAHLETIAGAGSAPAGAPSASSTPATTEPGCDEYTDNDQYPIQLCDSGPAVTALQTALLQTGDDTVDVDGNFGPVTDEAVRRFQEAHDLEADGLVGEQTWAALIAFLPPQGADADGNGAIDPDEIRLSPPSGGVGPGLRFQPTEGAGLLNFDTGEDTGVVPIQFHPLSSDDNYVFVEVEGPAGHQVWASIRDGEDEAGNPIYRLLDTGDVPGPGETIDVAFGCSVADIESNELAFALETDPAQPSVFYGGWQFDAVDGSLQGLGAEGPAPTCTDP